ncbi:MAG: flagellar biosynthesis protein FlhF [Gammaproteobacteria bacterium]
MKIKRFCAPDMRQAMRLVRETLGAEAVILSNRNVEEGVEIVAAMDFDQEMIQARVTDPDATVEQPVPSSDTSDRKRPPSASTEGSPKTAAASATTAPSAPLPGFFEKSIGCRKTDRTPVPVPTSPSPGFSGSDKAMAHALPSAPAMEPVLEEMRKEFGLMRDLLNSRIAEISWAESVRHHPRCKKVLRRLGEYGFSEAIGQMIIKDLDTRSDFSSAWDKVKENISRQLTVLDDNLLDHGGIVALLGPTGVGKTTTIAKLAARFCLKYGSRKIALVTVDNYRIAAYEQLNTYGRILDIPVRTAHDNAELEKVLAELMDKRLVLIDSAGVSQRNLRLGEQFPLLCGKELPIRSYLVMSAATHYATMQEIIRSFKVFEPYAAILTKLDETVTVAPAVSALIENQLALSFVCDGQKVPENLKNAKEYGLTEHCFSQESGSGLPLGSSPGILFGSGMQACG